MGDDAEETKGKRGRQWRGVGPAGRPSLFPFGGSIILKFDIDMTREEARNVFGGSIVNELLSLGAEPTNAYNSGCVSIYEAKDKTLRYSVYRDGCFYPYYGKLEVAE